MLAGEARPGVSSEGIKWKLRSNRNTYRPKHLTPHGYFWRAQAKPHNITNKKKVCWALSKSCTTVLFCCHFDRLRTFGVPTGKCEFRNFRRTPSVYDQHGAQTGRVSVCNVEAYIPVFHLHIHFIHLDFGLACSFECRRQPNVCGSSGTFRRSTQASTPTLHWLSRAHMQFLNETFVLCATPFLNAKRVTAIMSAISPAVSRIQHVCASRVCHTSIYILHHRAMVKSSFCSISQIVMWFVLMLLLRYQAACAVCLPVPEHHKSFAACGTKSCQSPA